jgi:hypothetical protein
LGEASVTPEDLDSFGSIYGANGLSLTFAPGIAQRDFYYRDQITGFPEIQAVHQGGTLTSSSQTAVITPNRTDHLSLHHSFSLSNPLSVRNEGVISVYARDQFNNLADGGRSLGEDNGFVYRS